MKLEGEQQGRLKRKDCDVAVSDQSSGQEGVSRMKERLAVAPKR